MSHLSRVLCAATPTALLLTTLAGCSSGGGVDLSENPYARPAPASPYAMIDGEKVPVPRVAMGDARTVEAIIAEGQTDNRVMDHLTHLTQEIGPRLTGSQAEADAVRWIESRFRAWGLENVRLHEWGTIATRFDRGPSSGLIYVQGDEEPNREMEFTTLAWVKGTDGPVRGHAVRMPSTMEELDAVRDRLDGAWVIVPTQYAAGRRGIRGVGGQMRNRHEERAEIREKLEAGEYDFDTQGEVLGAAPEGMTRWTGAFVYQGTDVPLILDVSDMAVDDITGVFSVQGFHEGPIENASFADNELTFTWPNPMGESTVSFTIDGQRGSGKAVASSGDAYDVRIAMDESEPTVVASEMILAEVLRAGPAGFVSSSNDERVWTTSKSGWRETELADYAEDVEVSIRASDYDYINSRLTDGAEVELEFDLDHRLVAGPVPVHNVIGEIVGTEMPDEVVIMSAHLDSWNGPGSEGCTDNGTGSSVTMEAARLLATVGARPKRTLRFILWTGEEQGLLGSRAYVESLSDEERAKISAVFVDDGGTNYQGGTPALAGMVEYLAAATAPLNGRFFSPTDYEAAMSDDDPDNDADAGLMLVDISTLRDREGNELTSLPRGGGSDHAAFNAVGVPGFFWNETGRAVYRYGWHTQNDTIDLAIPEYLMQSATNSAVTLYNLSCAPGLLPRPATEESETAMSR
ncbi:MAG: M20/M25/M40 family metallo-hydrolase [Phycisphaerales bacterium JB040]